MIFYLTRQGCYERSNEVLKNTKDFFFEMKKTSSSCSGATVTLLPPSSLLQPTTNQLPKPTQLTKTAPNRYTDHNCCIDNNDQEWLLASGVDREASALSFFLSCSGQQR
jgi:hypothetical protein